MTTAEQTQLQAAKPEVLAVSKAAQTPINNFRSVLERMKPQIQLALPRHVSPDRMLRIVLTTVQRTPKLLECTRESLLGCIVQCAQLGLEPDGLLGHAYLIPFWNGRENRFECQLIVGYKGLRKLAWQSGEISSVSSRVVHAKDDFEYEYGLEEKLRHVPTDEADPGPVVAAYAIFRLKDGGHHFEVMTAREINRIRDNSQGYKRNKATSPWSEHYEEMAKKTAFRRASKMAPASIEDRLAPAFALEDKAEAGLPQNLEAMDDDGVPALPAGENGATSEGAAAQEPKEFVVSTLKQRKEIVRLCQQVRIAEEDAAKWCGKAAIDELSREEAEYVGKRLTEQLKDESGGAIT